MNIPISRRLLCCGEMVREGSRVADIGTDHGYLGIWLLVLGKAVHVTASDLRSGPIRKAEENAKRFGTSDRMRFCRADGLSGIDPEEADTIICAGMGGDLICMILSACEWIRDGKYTLVLQPQSGGQAVRAWLGENGFGIEEETLTEDGGFLYTVLRARYGNADTLSPGKQYVSPQLLKSGNPFLPAYLRRIEEALRRTVEGIERAREPDEGKLNYYRTALAEVSEMRKEYGNGTRDYRRPLQGGTGIYESRLGQCGTSLRT